MNCKSVQTMLRETLWAGEETWPASLGEHLAGCKDCRAAAERERSLIDRMDAEMRSTVSVPVPASLAARVRIGLETPSPQRNWLPRYALASVGILFVALVGLRVAERQRTDGKLTLVQSQEHHAHSPVQRTPPGPADLLANRVADPRPVIHVKSPGHLAPPHRAVSSRQPARLEILVGAEEARGFQQLARAVQRRPELGRELVATAAPPAEVFVAPLAIPEVRVASLDEGNR